MKGKYVLVGEGGANYYDDRGNYFHGLIVCIGCKAFIREDNPHSGMHYDLFIVH